MPMDTHQCSGCAVALPLLSASIPRAAFLAGSLAAATATSTAARALEPSSSTQAGAPTTVFVAKKIVTMEPGGPATAVAVRGSTFVAVGTLDEVRQQLGPGTFTIDARFQNEVVYPGLIEQHLHPLLGALSMASTIIAIEDWDVPGKFSKAARNNEEYVSRLEAAINAMDAPPDETLFTWGYHQYFHGNVYRPQLDKLSPTRAVVVWHRSCHELIFNTAALQKYGITQVSVEGHGPASDQADYAQGHFYEQGLTLVLGAVGKDFATPARLESGVALLKSFVRSKGITTICEPGTQLSKPIQSFWDATLGGDGVGFRTYFIPDGRGLYAQYKAEPDKLLPATAAFMSWGTGNVSWLPNQIKLFCDGAIFSLLMQVEQPYLDGHKGEWIAEPGDYAAAFKAYWDAGYHIHTHVNGDAGLQLVIDTLANNMQSVPRKDHRFTVVHFAVSQDEQVGRIAALGGIISANPYYVSALADRYSEMGLGPERANSMVRLGSALKNDISISLHSDMPMAPADPLFLVWCAVNRTTVSGRTADPDQRISVDQAMRAVTIDAAYSLNLEDEIGSIKPGKRADLTVFDRDPMTIDPAQIKSIRVVGTVFAGVPIAPEKGSEPLPATSDDAHFSENALNSPVG